MTVDDAAGRALFYAFVETPGDPAAAPLVLWLNGCAGQRTELWPAPGSDTGVGRRQLTCASIR